MSCTQVPVTTGDGPPRGHVAIRVEPGPQATTIFIRGELDLTTMPLLAEQLSATLPARPGRLVFDLAETTFVDCGCARLIAQAGQSCGRRPLVRHPSRAARRVFELTGLDARCEIAE